MSHARPTIASDTRFWGIRRGAVEAAPLQTPTDVGDLGPILSQKEGKGWGTRRRTPLRGSLLGARLGWGWGAPSRPRPRLTARRGSAAEYSRSLATSVMTARGIVPMKGSPSTSLPSIRSAQDEHVGGVSLPPFRKRGERMGHPADSRSLEASPSRDDSPQRLYFAAAARSA